MSTSTQDAPRNSGSAEALARLKEAALTGYSDLRAAVAATGKAVVALHGSDELVDAIRIVNRLGLACGALHKIAELQGKTADGAIVEAIEDSGAPAIRGDHHVLSTKCSPGSVEILDHAAVPERFMAQPKPRADKDAIRKAILAGEQLGNWATFHPGSPCLVRKAITS